MTHKVWKSPEGSLFEYEFWCPGCEEYHGIRTIAHTEYLKKNLLPGPDRTWLEKHNWPTWTFNGNFEKPTVHPSIHIKLNEKSLCHFFVEAGNIRYLNDCRHKLAGKSIFMIADPN